MNKLSTLRVQFQVFQKKTRGIKVLFYLVELVGNVKYQILIKKNSSQSVLVVENL